MSPSDLEENIMECIHRAAEKIPGKWKNILSIHIKTADSIALPIFSKVLLEEDGGDAVVEKK